MQRSCATLWRFKVRVWERFPLRKSIYTPYAIKRCISTISCCGNDTLKILKRPFGYFCGSGQKLHAQQSGIKLRNTKHLNGNRIHCRSKGATHKRMKASLSMVDYGRFSLMQPYGLVSKGNWGIKQKKHIVSNVPFPKLFHSKNITKMTFKLVSV